MVQFHPGLQADLHCFRTTEQPIRITLGSMVQFHPGLRADLNFFMTDTIHISEENAGKRLDVFLVEETGLSRSQVQKSIKEQSVLVNDAPAKKTGQLLHAGDNISFLKKEDGPTISATKEPVLHPSDHPIHIIHESNDFLVVEKPAGLLVHPTQASEKDTLAGRLIHLFPGLAGVGDSPVRPGIVHRLDRDASGLLVVAKTQKMFEHLKSQFKARTIKKEYVVLVHGLVEKEYGSIDFTIDRGKEGRMVARPKVTLNLKNVNKMQPGKEALTDYSVEKRFVRHTLLRVRIHTGRMHQIRVHMFAFNHPVVGDTLYINKKLSKKSDRPLHRMFLHAQTLCFQDLSGKEMCFSSELPQELQSYLDEFDT